MKNFVGISPNNFKEIQSRLDKTIKLNGKEFIASYYDILNYDNDFLFISSDEIELEELDGETNDNAGTEDEYDFTDDSICLYCGLRSIINPYLSDKMVFYFDENEQFAVNQNNLEKARKFISKNKLNIVDTSLIAFIDTTIFGGAKEGILLTTSTLYYKNAFSDVVGLRYFSIDSADTKIISVSNDKTALRVSGSEPYDEDTIISFDIPSTEINPSGFAQMLQDIFVAMDNVQGDDLFDVVSISDGRNHPYEMGIEVVKPYISLLLNFYNTFEKKNRDGLYFFVYHILCRSNLNENDNLAAVFSEITEYHEETSANDALMDLKKHCYYPSYPYAIECLAGDCHRLNYSINGDGLSVQANDWLRSLLRETDGSVDDAEKFVLFTYLHKIEDDILSNDELIHSTNLLKEIGIGAAIGGILGWFAFPLAIIAGPAYGILSSKNRERKAIQLRLQVLEEIKEQYHETVKKLISVETKYNLKSDGVLSKSITISLSKKSRIEQLIIKYKRRL